MAQRLSEKRSDPLVISEISPRWPRAAATLELAPPDGILVASARARRRQINSLLHDHFAGIVQDGPFRGMKVSRESSWGDGDIAPRLLGCYEAELHGAIRWLAGSGYSTIINIGYAEGYYVVGLARALPGARVIGFDAMPEAQRVCRLAAHMNGVSERVQLHGVCDAPTLNGFIERGCFLLVDCEGAEKELLRPDLVPRLASVDLLVECHDFIDASITKTLQDRFRSTHHIDFITEGSRNPTLYPALIGFSSLDRWLSVCEFRPTAMHWMLLTNRSP